MEEVIILGAGLSGLATAYYLKQKGISALLLEARPRAGGRIETLLTPPNATPVEMGATWFAGKHTYLMDLVKELRVAFFPQFQKGLCVYESAGLEPPQLFTMPANEPPSYRIKGGTVALIDRLVTEVGAQKILFQTQVSRLYEQDDCLLLWDKNQNCFSAQHVVVTLPPNLLLKEIAIHAALPAGLLRVMRQTHTWMSDAIKFALVYDQPFWRNKGYAGTVLSQSGIATEVYDHTNAEETRFALKGFLAPGAALSKAQRQEKVIVQLKTLLGEEAASFLSYNEKLWSNDPYTHAAYQHVVLPHQNSGHSLYAQAYLNGRLFISGSETSPVFGGYMDGAVYSGLHTAARIAKKLQRHL